MSRQIIFCVFAVLIAAAAAAPPTVNSTDKKKVVCYFASWTVYRNGDGKFDVSNIDPFLCTHINFGFVGLNEDASIHILDPWESDPSGLNGFAKLVALKQKNPDLKVMVSMGGWNEGSATYSKVASKVTLRQQLADNVLTFLSAHNFDGFDLDWEYPALRGGNEKIDTEDYTALMKTLYKTLNPAGYLLSAAVAGGFDKITVAYDVRAFMPYVDFVNVMVFDFHGAFDGYIGHIAPLYPAKVDYDYGDNSSYNVEAGIEKWISFGADPSKLNLGVTTYGRSFTMTDTTATELYDPVVGPGKQGPYSGQEGILGYNEICTYHMDSDYIWDDEQKVPHRIWDDQWVGFDDEVSIRYKIEFALQKKLGGIMVWSFDYDDFRGKCGDPYPLLRTVNDNLYKQ